MVEEGQQTDEVSEKGDSEDVTLDDMVIIDDTTTTKDVAAGSSDVVVGQGNRKAEDDPKRGDVGVLEACLTTGAIGEPTMDDAESDFDNYDVDLGIEDTASEDHDHAAIKEARKHEMQKMDELEFGECIPTEELQDHKHLKARWVDDKRDNGWLCMYVAK